MTAATIYKLKRDKITGNWYTSVVSVPVSKDRTKGVTALRELRHGFVSPLNYFSGPCLVCGRIERDSIHKVKFTPN